ncbi:MAG: response regulator [Oscillospiraceae bacterium]|nr:response regulator [Oscillospiraceae bacterium]
MIKMSKELKVLICDDSALVRKQMTKIFNAQGITNVQEAVDGNQAVLKYAEYMPDIVFMDIVMPQKTGVEALKDIISLNPAAKVVMASSIGTQANLKDAIENGAYDFIQKPVSEESVIKILGKIND